MNEEARNPGPDPNLNPELFDDYDIREERKPTPESEAYYKSLMARMGEIDNDDKAATRDDA